MNQIKNKLKTLSNKQEIHDLSNDIINSVDKSKVLSKNEVVAPRRSFRFVPLLAASLTLVVLIIGFSISGFNNPTNINNQVPTNNPLNPNQPVINDPNTTTTIQTIDLYKDTVEVVEFLKKASNQETFNLVNAANSISNVTFSEVETSLDKQLTISEEEALVNDLYNYIYNIEYMLGLSDVNISDKSDNTNQDYNYQYDTAVSTSYCNYHIYYDETITEEKETQSNYKSKSDINGILKYDNSEYILTTTKIIKNSIVEYNTTIKLDDNNSIIINEKYGLGENIFKYEYHKNDLVKTITIDQNLDTDGNTKQININFDFTSVVIKLEIKPTTDVISCKIKSRDDTLNITKADNKYIFKFNKSQNSYEK